MDQPVTWHQLNDVLKPIREDIKEIQSDLKVIENRIFDNRGLIMEIKKAFNDELDNKIEDKVFWGKLKIAALVSATAIIVCILDNLLRLIFK